LPICKKKAYTIIPTLFGQTSIDFWSESTKEFVGNLRKVKTDQVQVIGTEKIFGKIFDDIGFGQIPDQLFKDLERILLQTSSISINKAIKAFYKMYEIIVPLPRGRFRGKPFSYQF
jgi:hypothetical protein